MSTALGIGGLAVGVIAVLITIWQVIERRRSDRDRARLDEILSRPLMIPKGAGGSHSSQTDDGGVTRVVNMVPDFQVENSGPDEPALGVTGGVEIGGVEYPADGRHEALAAQRMAGFTVRLPNDATRSLSVQSPHAELTTWVRYADRRGRRWRTARLPLGELVTTQEWPG